MLSDGSLDVRTYAKHMFGVLGGEFCIIFPLNPLRFTSLQACAKGGGRGAYAPPDFGRSEGAGSPPDF